MLERERETNVSCFQDFLRGFFTPLIWSEFNLEISFFLRRQKGLGERGGFFWWEIFFPFSESRET